LISYTQFIKVGTMGQRINCLLKNITSEGICLECGKKTKWVNAYKEYTRYCGTKCSANADAVRLKTKNTCISKYGGTTPMSDEGIADKMRKAIATTYSERGEEINVRREQTCIKRYGVRNPMQDPAINQRLRDSVAIIWKDEQKTAIITAKRENTCIERYGVRNPSQVKEFHDKKFKDNYKDYALPSGKVWRVQGYEPQALDILLTQYSEQEIEHEPFSVDYITNGKTHRYYPDFYIRHINTIIEVKSQYILDLHKDLNIRKEDACIEQGYKFMYMVIEK